MKIINYFLSALFVFVIVISCDTKNSNEKFISGNISIAEQQYGLMVEMIEDSGRLLIPKSIIDGKMKFISPNEWT